MPWAPCDDWGRIMKTKVNGKLSKKQRHAEKQARQDSERHMADLAQRYLDRHQPRGYRINVDRNAVELRGDTWFIVANPDRTSAPGYDFINRITEASMELEEKENIHVFLLPVIPPEDD